MKDVIKLLTALRPSGLDPALDGVQIWTDDEDLHMARVEAGGQIAISVQVPRAEGWEVPEKIVTGDTKILDVVAKMAKITRLAPTPSGFGVDGESPAGAQVHADIAVLPSDSAPEIEGPEEAGAEHIEALSDAAVWPLAAIISRAAAREKERPHLASVYIGWAGDNSDNIDIAATDGHRLAAWVELEGAPQIEAVVPRRAIELIARVVGNYTPQVWVTRKVTDEGIARVERIFARSEIAEGCVVTISAKCLDVRFPPWRELIAEQYGEGAPMVQGTLAEWRDALNYRTPGQGVVVGVGDEGGATFRGVVLHGAPSWRIDAPNMQATGVFGENGIALNAEYLLTAADIISDTAALTGNDEPFMVLRFAEQNAQLAPVQITDGSPCLRQIIMPLKV